MKANAQKYKLSSFNKRLALSKQQVENRVKTLLTTFEQKIDD